jgi:hypothetical protein
MNGKVESCSNNQDESDVNQYLKELSEVSDWRSRRNVSVCQESGSLEPIALLSVDQCPVLAHLGQGTMSELSLLCDQKRTSLRPYYRSSGVPQCVLEVRLNYQRSCSRSLAANKPMPPAFRCKPSDSISGDIVRPIGCINVQLA